MGVLVRMFKMKLGKENDYKIFKFERYGSFRYFKPDLALKGLRLKTEAKFEKGLFYEIQNK